jgi:hypothetical protein
LRNSLIIPSTFQERETLVEEKINENLFVFLEYMEGLQSTPFDFLKIIVNLLPKLEQDDSTKLFVRVCALFKGEELVVSYQMIQ